MPKDPINTGIEKGIEEAAKMAKDYLDKLITPALEEGGGIIGDTVAYWRFKNKVNLVLKAKAFLESKGIQPKQLLPKVVAPLLEAGSLEEDEDMKSRWAALLASAATDPISVPPFYPKILSELSSSEARILEWMAERTEQQIGWVLSGQEIRTKFLIMPPQYEVLMGNLVRLNLCSPLLGSGTMGKDYVGAEDWPPYQQVQFTRLGYSFVKACQA
jgi:hypothetical protein